MVDGTPSPRDPQREAFLMQMYGEMWSNVNRHLSIVWQSAGVLAGAFAIFALVEKKTISVDLASSLLILVAAWLVAHTYDANAWFNRNLVIVANIERQFLTADDAREIHYFFTRHRAGSNMVGHLQIHRNLGMGIAALVVLYHFLTQVVPGIGQPFSHLEFQRFLPYITGLISGWWIWRFRRERIKNHEKFLNQSPGRTITSSPDVESR
ncbi:MAG TPA: hypothetical protein VIF83_00040 [Gemmatimonadaceae bacterium]|jgi:hypothetical protein